jgi:hypothetical protein
MVLTWIVISSLVGALFGFGYRVFVLVPASFLLLVGIEVAGLAIEAPAWSVFAAILFASTGLQLSYLVGATARMVISQSSGAELQMSAYSRGHGAVDRVALRAIREHMEVVGSDGRHVGTIDHKEDDRRIVLSAYDPTAGGRPHLITTDWVDHVNDKVHLNKPSMTAFSEWLLAA